ncbi:hypothetical protein CMO93_03385 [Candidatus Woesearchaeota archaeon]|nr:hypothetical protein [Candidatus Woesearchaeota archaeon]|tara:strand:+ start:3203 stop:4276 length:1074 start_codon:yes stop_codon:yes gene_type:complete
MIIAIVLVGLFSLIFYFNSLETETPKVQQALEIPSEIVPVKAFVDTCIKSVAEDSIVLTSLQGGYFEVPKSVEFLNDDIYTSYYFIEDLIVMPSLDIIEQELAKSMNALLPFCLENFSSFAQQGIKVENKDITAKASILNNEVLFEVSMPTSINSGDSFLELNKFITTIPDVRLKTVYEASRNFTETHLKNPEGICISCMINIGEENDIYFYSERLDNSSFIFVIIDNNTQIDSIPLLFSFTNKYKIYSCSNPPPDPDPFYLEDCIEKQIENTEYKLLIEQVPDLKGSVGALINYKIKVIGVDLTYEVNPPLFKLEGKEPTISFTPSEENIGNNTIWVSVNDGFGNRKTISFNLIIQ